MEDDQSNVIEKLKATIQGNDAETLREILKSSPEAVGLIVDGLPLLHYICKQPGAGSDIVQTIIQCSDVNLTSAEVGKCTKSYLLFCPSKSMALTFNHLYNFWVLLNMQ